MNGTIYPKKIYQLIESKYQHKKVLRKKSSELGLFPLLGKTKKKCVIILKAHGKWENSAENLKESYENNYGPFPQHALYLMLCLVT